MHFRKRLIQVCLILYLVTVLFIFLRRYTRSEEKVEEPLISLSRISKEKVKSNVHFESDTTQKYRCRYSFANFTIYDFDLPLYPYLHCIPFSTLTGLIPICVHYKLKENFAENIRKMGQGNPSVSEDFEQFLMNNAEYDVIDIGANIGMYSLLAANLKRLVFAVEPMDINVKIFHQTILLNRMETLITLVVGKALFDDYKTIRLSAIYNGSITWTEYSVRGYKPRKRYHVMETQFLETIMMDDLINAVPFDKAIMVINIDGNDATVIKGGQRFFDCLDIAYVFMEWSKSFINDKIFIVDFFSGRNYTAHASTSDIEGLSFDVFFQWPPNIVWKKNYK